MDTRERAKAILHEGRMVNYPHPDETGMRIVGWVVPQDLAGLGLAGPALEEISSAATAHFKSS